MFVRYSTPHVHYPQLNSSRACLPTNFQKFSKTHSKGKVHKADKSDKKLNHLSFQSTEQLNKNMGIKRDKSAKSSSQIAFRSSNVIFLFVFECVSVFMNYKVSGGGIFIDWDIVVDFVSFRFVSISFRTLLVP
jgi:hypothetical protein